MAVEGISPVLAIRSGAGVEFWSSTDKHHYELNANLPREESKNCRAIIFSPDGRYFALSNGSTVKIIGTSDWKVICSLPRPKAFHLKFSPKGNFLVTWELFTVSKDKPEGAPNLYVYEVSTSEEVFSLIHKKQSEWEPCWSADESLFALMVGGEARFYELKGKEGFDTSTNKLGSGRNGILSIAPGQCPPHLAFYVPGTGGSPSMCKIYRYPSLQQNQTLACKSFFQADRVEMLWNKRGTGLLLLTSTEVDQTGASYYGKQALHFMSTKGDSFAVQLAKEGPIHSVTWSPKSTEFLVVYGYMPAKATLFNLKCDITFDFGEASRNSSYFNDFGNLLILAGFGNLRGYVEVWDMNRKKQISSLQAPDSTLLEWCPSGETFVTATTAPRLRIANGFKVWHYSGALLHETLWPQGQELLEVVWQKFADGMFNENTIKDEKIEGIKSSQPEASKQVYQPPNVRLMKEGKLGGNGNADQLPIIPGLPPGYTGQKNTSSNSNRQKKSRRKKDNKTSEAGLKPTPATNNNNKKQQPQQNAPQQQGQQETNSTEQIDVPGDDSNKPTKEQAKPQQRNAQKNRKNHHANFPPTGDPEKDQKMRNIAKRLQDIAKLKTRQGKGENLEANQLAKIATESTLVQELNSLKIAS